MGIFGWLSSHGSHAGDEQNTRQIGEAMERLLNLSPQLRLAQHCHARLAPAVATSLKHIGDLAASLPAPRDINAAAWSSDPYIHAYFAAPDDIARTLGRSEELRAYFDQNMDAQEAYGVLGMTMTERLKLGAAQEGDNMRGDVMQKTVSFSDHRVRICGRTEADLREEIVRRGVDQLGLEGLARIAAGKTRRDQLEHERALLKTRLQLLERQGAGMRSMLGNGNAHSDLTEPGKYARLQEQLAENERNLRSLGVRTEALERELDQLCEVLANPGTHLYIESRHFRLNGMNVELPESAASAMQPGKDLTFQIARIPANPPQMRAFALVRIARSDMVPARSLADEAARLLG